MRRRTAVAALVAGLAVTVMAPAPASACRPEQFPYCQQSYCAGLAVLYGQLAASSDLPFPAWPHVGVAGCP